MPYKDPNMKKQKDREYYRRTKENSNSSDPSQTEGIQMSEEKIQELTTIKGLCRMLAKHILILDEMKLDQVIKAKTISTLSNVMGRILVSADLEEEVQAMRQQIDEILQQQMKGREA